MAGRGQAMASDRQRPMKITAEYGKLTPVMDDNRLFMVGVIHRDKEGPALLRNWVEQIDPDVITLELSRYGVQLRMDRGKEFRARIHKVLRGLEADGVFPNEEAVSMLLAYLAIPYEFEVAARYAGPRGIPLHLVDMDFFSYVKLQKIEELLSEENIRRMACQDTLSDEGKEKVMARLVFEKGLKIAPYDDEMYVRDKYITGRIRLLMEDHSNKKFLHVCGWQHLQDPANLYGPLNPAKVFFYDKTLCL
ncbi:MAG: hypothetical protein A4E65_01528 [Syntrophorhabdus sp. PtaU1.Bin153]|nr:MAG: hypothetical protein A4E65_01528 [Syntrophorhabdus sp. PtaU1.Bin153]